MNEPTGAVWKPVPGYEGRYEVSDAGHVRSLSSYRATSGGILATWVQNKGYHYVTLRSANGTKKSFAVHRLVLEAFVGPRPAGKQAAHADGNPAHNSLTNLRWATAKENIADRTAHGRTRSGEQNGSAKLDRFVVRTIKRLKGTNVSAYEVARLACISPSTVQSIWNNETWSHV
ncbi:MULTISPECIES: NUMOD4 motif-containing HNH endonuclease [unclassified Cupriavidus]|uniref:NUMOD4 motif-containing HNH endonuclease n=1 Tax=Cupriavidus sp. H19C3 TaxID=3241603 RepID=UPI003BF8594E